MMRRASLTPGILWASLTLLISGAVQASPTEDALRLWAAQSGDWEGIIEIYGPGGPGEPGEPNNSEPQTVDLKTTWASTPKGDVLVKIETFLTPDRQMSSVTVMVAEPSSGEIVTSYFTNGSQRDYRFAVLDVSKTDDTHWVTVIASPGGEEIYEDRPAVLRYVRTRSGNTIENTKEVNFLDDDGDDTYELRSFIRQSLISQ